MSVRIGEGGWQAGLWVGNGRSGSSKVFVKDASPVPSSGLLRFVPPVYMVQI